MITIYVRDLSGNEYACQATITNVYELNGNRELSATILPSKVNRIFIDDIAEMWEITDFDDVAHKIVYAKKKGEGNLLSVEIKAVPLFFDTFDTERIYDEYNEHMTAMRCFTLIFEDSGYNFVLVDSFDALEWEGLGGGETRLEMFKRALNRYGAEFRISGNTVYLHKQVGRDTQFQYRHRLNASNIVQENDATAMWTYAKGYGDYEEGDEEGGGGWENANLIREYTSPLAKIPQIGIRHAPPIKDGRISDKATMDRALKELVDESLKISVTADIHDLRRQGYPLAQPELGDRVFLIDERIGLDEEVRVVDISITRNWRGEVIDLNLSFGSEGITKRYQSNLSTAIKNITEVMAGRKKIPMSAYDQAVINATATLKRVTSELTVPSNGGLMAVDKNNPNNVVLFNAAGIGVSDDGGATFKNSITGEGVVAETIIGDHIIGVNLSSIDESGYFHVNGSNAEFFDTNTGRRVSISPSGIYGYNANDSIRFQADSTLVTSAALGTSNLNVYLAAGDSDLLGEVRAVRRDTLGGSGNPADYSYINVRARAIKSPPTANAYIGTDGELRIMSEGLTSGIYRNARMNKTFANELEVNGGNILYLRTDSRVRIMGKGSSGAYSDLQLAHIQAQSIRKNTEMAGTHFYLGSGDGELRVTSNGLADGVARSVRARSFLLPDGSSAFGGLSSSLSVKPKEDEAIGLVKNTELVRYTDGGEPAYKISDTSKSIDEMLGTVIKATQELIEKVGA